MSKLKIAIGAAVITGLGVAGVANASVDANDGLFSMDQLSSGYLTAGDKEGSCGEGKCGEDKKKDGEGSCGGDKIA